MRQQHIGLCFSHTERAGCGSCAFGRKVEGPFPGHVVRVSYAPALLLLGRYGLAPGVASEGVFRVGTQGTVRGHVGVCWGRGIELRRRCSVVGYQDCLC